MVISRRHAGGRPYPAADLTNSVDVKNVRRRGAPQICMQSLQLLAFLRTFDWQIFAPTPHGFNAWRWRCWWLEKLCLVCIPFLHSCYMYLLWYWQGKILWGPKSLKWARAVFTATIATTLAKLWRLRCKLQVHGHDCLREVFEAGSKIWKERCTLYMSVALTAVHVVYMCADFPVKSMCQGAQIRQG